MSSNKSFSDEYIRLLANVLYPINITVEFQDDLDHSNFLGLQWELTHVGRVGVGIDKSDTDFNKIGKKLGSKTHQLTNAELPKITGKFAPVVPGNYGNFVDGIIGLEQKVGTAWQPQANTNADVYGYTISFGGNQPHSIIQPSEVTSFWKRVA